METEEAEGEVCLPHRMSFSLHINPVAIWEIYFLVTHLSAFMI
jgi:hypothetical protein